MNIPTIAELLSSHVDHVKVNISGGKDSTALLVWQAFHCSHIASRSAVHAHIDIDWAVTDTMVRKHAAMFELPLEVVQAVKADGKPSGFLRQLTSPRINRKTGETGEYKFPDMGNRWCTSMLKTGPCAKTITPLKGVVLNLMGERREESAKRAQLEPVRLNKKLSNKSRTVWDVSPILDMTEAEVWRVITDSGAPVHPCYSWGVSRASCAICVFSSKADIKIAAEREPELVRRYIEAEASIDHSFHYNKTTDTKTSIADILKQQGVTL